MPFGVKISPFSDPHALARLADALARRANEWPDFRFVTATNTFPNAYARTDAGAASIAMGFGGLGGPALKPIALAHVKQLRDALPPRVDLIGVGGIISGRDAADYLAVGAAGVQATTTYWNGRGASRTYADILSGLAPALA